MLKIPHQLIKTHLIPCLSPEQLLEWGVKIDDYPDVYSGKGNCANLSAIPASSTDFKFSRQQLNISIPQAAMLFRPQDYVSPDKWDEGIPALLLSYNLSGYYHASTQITAARMEAANTVVFNRGINVGPLAF
ncbi:F1 capsule-anchoring protein precursor [Kluyvera cryocrescens]|uniref:F1 capsule-anchoring protein n=1 Tax=Kluyvera cryocrescens TaxID=580 RepID=A0A485A537_KLUCR|nr:F1 capsule-anchoring protein precursor [Kluyvera cryocrescens]